MWSALAKPLDPIKANDLEGIFLSLKKTEAWDFAMNQIVSYRWNHVGRLKEYRSLIDKICDRNCEQIFFFHHYDALNYFPKTWLLTLEEIANQGWLVVVSSSTLSSDTENKLEARNILVSRRVNLGMCLGAYRDFSLLVLEKEEILKNCKRFVLANDSTLPIKGPSEFLKCLNDIAFRLDTQKPTLIGMTDSVERSLYHLQSYFLAVNASLLQEKVWKEFWNSFSLFTDKDDLINQGEIGLTQAMIKYNIQIISQYSLIDIFLQNLGVGTELETFNISRLIEVNLTLFAWETLLKAGSPLIKKQVLLKFPERAGSVIPLSQIFPWVSDNDNNLKNDLKALLCSRFSAK